MTPALWILRFFYSIRLAQVVFAQQSIGCFKSSPIDLDLPYLVDNRVNSLNQCIKECKAQYYMFSGLMNGHQCYCGSQYGRNGPSEDCNIKCMDSSALCGSDKAINVYSTNQKGPSPPRRIEISKYKKDSLEITWQPPDISNGKIISYTLRAKALESMAPYPLPPIEIEVVGDMSNLTSIYGLHPGTKYNITISASNAQGSSDEAYIIDWTRIGPPYKPQIPKILQKSDNSIVIEILPGNSENGPLTYYHVVVIQSGTVPPTGNDIAYEDYYKSGKEGLGYYITGKFDVSDYPQYKLFEIGDGRVIGGYYNAPLDKRIGEPQIGIALESRVRGEVQYSYSDLTSSMYSKIYSRENQDSNISAANIILWILIVLLGVLFLTSVVIFVMLRKRFQQVRMRRLPEQQELTLQGPMYEVDNMAYIPEDMPERTNHYQELKSKVWSIPRNVLNFDNNPIRRGRFGFVHMGTVQKELIPIEASVHKILDTQLKGSEKRLMLRELDVCIKAGSSKYIASLVGNCETQDTLFVAFELPPQSLKTRLLAARSGDYFPYDQMLRIGACIANGFQHLESLKIVHSCVCARNVGLTLDWSPKIMGHGLSKYGLEDVKYARWTAIECFSNQQKHQPGVVWAYGILLWEIFSIGGTPYSDMEMDSDVETAINDGYRLQQLRDLTDPLYEVMSSCWLLDPAERPTFDELVRLDTLSICPITSITEPYRPELELN